MLRWEKICSWKPYASMTTWPSSSASKIASWHIARSDSKRLTGIPMLKHALAFLVFIAISCPALAQPALDYSPGHGKVQAVAETKALLASVSEAMDKQQAELEAGIRYATARAKWSEQDRVRFFQTVLRSKPNTDFEKQIELLTIELRGMLQASQRGEIRGPEADYRYVARLRELVGQLKSVYARQSVYLTQQLRNVKSAQRP